MFEVVSIAGGIGTRLSPLTLTVPKSLVPINGRPFIDWQLELLSKSGIRKVVLCLGHQANLIQEFVGDGSRYGIEVDYSIERSKLGTGGALVHALPRIGRVFGVLYGDSYLPINYLEIFEKFESDSYLALMTIIKNDNGREQSNVRFFDNRILNYSKNDKNDQFNYLDFGFLVSKREVFEDRSPGSIFDLGDKLSEIARRGQIQGFEVFRSYFEVGSFQGIKELEVYLSEIST